MAFRGFVDGKDVMGRQVTRAGLGLRVMMVVLADLEEMAMRYLIIVIYYSTLLLLLYNYYYNNDDIPSSLLLTGANLQAKIMSKSWICSTRNCSELAVCLVSSLMVSNGPN